MSEVYLGNPNLKKVNVAVEFTQEQIVEFERCSKDPLYFIQNYVKIVSLDEGLVPFKMYNFQKEMVGTMHNNRFTICKLPRQSGKSTTIVSYLLHYVLFNPNTNYMKGGWKNSLGRVTSDIGFLSATLVKFEIGPVNYLGYINGLSVNHLAFTQDMKPIRSDVSIQANLLASVGLAEAGQ